MATVAGGDERTGKGAETAPGLRRRTDGAGVVRDWRRGEGEAEDDGD